MLYDAETGDLTMAACGDAMITRKLSVFREQRFTGLMDLFRQADVGLANLEMLMHEYEHPPGPGGGTFTGSDPSNLEELKWAGINLVSCANNHHFDYGEGGVLTNLRHVVASGITHAGTGANLSEARAPGYLDTVHGRVALISAASTFSESGRALDQRPDHLGRPGLNPLRFETTHTIDRTAFDELHRISTDLGLEAKKAFEGRSKFYGTMPEDSDTEFHFLGEKFILGEEFKVETRPNARDFEENLKWIRNARRLADWVVVSFHCHESGSSLEEPPQFLTTFARACIDEGVDAFIGHGPHVIRGVEIYRGKPVLYSLGNFIFQNDTVRWQPSQNYDLLKLDHYATPADFCDARYAGDTHGFPSDPAYWESVVAQLEYKGGQLTQVRLHPIDLGYGRPRSQRGRPLLADGSLREKILERMIQLSEPFGTAVKVEDGVGVIRP